MAEAPPTPSTTSEPDPQRRVMRILAGVSVGGIVLAIVLAVAFPGVVGEGAASVVGGLACVLGVCVAFYAVGRSEDRERAQRTPDS